MCFFDDDWLYYNVFGYYEVVCMVLWVLNVLNDLEVMQFEFFLLCIWCVVCLEDFGWVCEYLVLWVLCWFCYQLLGDYIVVKCFELVFVILFEWD